MLDIKHYFFLRDLSTNGINYHYNHKHCIKSVPKYGVFSGPYLDPHFTQRNTDETYTDVEPFEGFFSNSS